MGGSDSRQDDAKFVMIEDMTVGLNVRLNGGGNCLICLVITAVQYGFDGGAGGEQTGHSCGYVGIIPDRGNVIDADDIETGCFQRFFQELIFREGERTAGTRWRRWQQAAYGLEIDGGFTIFFITPDHEAN